MEPNDLDNSGDDKEDPAEDYSWLGFDSISKGRDTDDEETRRK